MNPSRMGKRGALLLLGALACGGETDPPDGGGLAVAKAPTSGDAQTGTAGAALANPLAVLVTRDGAPAQGETVSWSIVSGGGTLGGASSTTGGNGIATMTWTLGQGAGAQGARAAVSGASGSPVAFTATATAGAAASIEAAGGNAQGGTVGTALASPLQVRVEDQFGNPVGGTAIAWSVTGGGGSMAPPNSNTAANGIASSTWTLGATVGAQTAQAAAAGLAGSPVAFTATGSAAPDPATGVTVSNNLFTPSTLTVEPGSTVTWTWVNTGIVQHSVLSVGTPSFTSSGILQGNGQTYSVTFDTPGTYDYECEVHGSAMAGQIVVQ
ncbi:MAG TPA: Ig-like domain-containing protein [Gemmatimonadales bacterium]